MKVLNYMGYITVNDTVIKEVEVEGKVVLVPKH